MSRKYEINYEINFPCYDAGADYADSDSSKDSKESHGKGLLNNFVYYLHFQNKLNLTSVRRSRHKIKENSDQEYHKTWNKNLKFYSFHIRYRLFRKEHKRKQKRDVKCILKIKILSLKVWLTMRYWQYITNSVYRSLCYKKKL